MTTSKRKGLSSLGIVLVGGFLMLLIPAGLTALLYKKAPVWSPMREPKPNLGPSFPDTDIVFKRDSELGFVNADGTGLTTIHFSVPSTNLVGTWQNPVMANIDKVYVTYTSAPGHPGEIFSAVDQNEAKAARDCKLYGTLRLTARGEVQLNTDETLYPDPAWPGDTGTPPPNQRYFVKARKDEDGETGKRKSMLSLIDTVDQKEWTIGEGDFPAWSRDGAWVAYTGPDGIYIVENASDAKPKRLVSLESSRPGELPVYQEDLENHYYPPIASWSEDSPSNDWLVYHVFSRRPVQLWVKGDARYYSIFRVRVWTGETLKVLDGGYSPFWRWSHERRAPGAIELKCSQP